MIDFMVKHVGAIAVVLIAVSSIATFIRVYKRDKNYNVPKKDYVIGAVLSLVVAVAVIYFVVSAYK